MSATEIIQQIKLLSVEEFAEVQAMVTEHSLKIGGARRLERSPELQLRQKSFDEAKRRVFSENRELFRKLAQ